jgi:hypothetical protein
VPFDIHDPHQTCLELAEQLQSAGHLRSREGVLLSTVLDDHVREHVGRGGRAIVLVDSESSLPEGAGLSAKLRAGNELDGRWFSNFNWVRWNRPPFDSFTFTRVLGFESAAVVPDLLLQGIPGSAFDDVLCGATFGWLQKNSGIVVQMSAGDGHLLVTTFRFDQYGKDAYATALMERLIEYVASDFCRPRWTLEEALQHVTAT